MPRAGGCLGRFGEVFAEANPQYKLCTNRLDRSIIFTPLEIHALLGGVAGAGGPPPGTLPSAAAPLMSKI